MYRNKDHEMKREKGNCSCKADGHSWTDTLLESRAGFHWNKVHIHMNMVKAFYFLEREEGKSFDFPLKNMLIRLMLVVATK